MTELMIRPQSDVEPYEPYDPSWQREDGTPIVHRPGVDYSPQEQSGTKEYNTEEQELPFESPETELESNETSVDTLDTREVSPTGTMLVRAAKRVNATLERRTVNKAHNEALKEDQTRAVESQEAAFATYEENIADTLSEDEAYSMNDKFDAKAARREKLEEAKNKVRGFGRRALRFLKNAGLLTVGAGALAGEYAAKKAKDGTEAVKEGATFAKDTVKLNAETAAAVVGYEVGQKVDAVKEGVQNRVEAVKTRVADTREMAGDMVGSVREGLRRRKEAALTRKYERHAKWMSFKKGVNEYTSSVKEGFGDTKDALKERAEKVKQNIRITKSAGRAALLTFRDHREAFKQ